MVKKLFGKKLKKGMKKIVAFALVAATVFSTKLPINAATTTNSELKVHYFNVGLGTCVIVEKDNHFMLVDTGTGKTALNEVETWIESKQSELKQQNKTFAFDYVVISHYDSDHVKNLAGILNLDDNTGATPNTENDISVGKFIARKYSNAVMVKMIENADKISTKIAKDKRKEAKQNNTKYFTNYIEFANVVALSSGDNSKVISSDINGEKIGLNIYKQYKNKGKYKNAIKEAHAKVVEIANLKNSDGTLVWKNPVKDYDCTFANDVKINFYSLNKDKSYIPSGQEHAESRNSDSLVFKITYGKSSFWFLNDLKKSGMVHLLGRTKAADYKNSVVLIPHHGIFHNNITKVIKSNLKKRLTSAKIFVRSVDEEHYRPTAADKQEQFMKIFTSLASKGGHPLYETHLQKTFEISTTGQLHKNAKGQNVLYYKPAVVTKK